MVDGATRRNPDGAAAAQNPNQPPSAEEDPTHSAANTEAHEHVPAIEAAPGPEQPVHQPEQPDEFTTPTQRAPAATDLPALSELPLSDIPNINLSARPSTSVQVQPPHQSYTNPAYSPRTIQRAVEHLRLSESTPVPEAVRNENQTRGNPRIRFTTTNTAPQATSSVGHINLSLKYPDKFNPETDNWILWESSVEMFIDRIGVNRAILQKQHASSYTPEEHSTVLGILQQISPDTDALWFVKLGLQWAYAAWDELKQSYGQRADTSVQQKLIDFDTTCQRPDESIKPWVVRLRREVKEIALMSSESVPVNTHKIKLIRVIPTPGNELLFRN